MKFKFLLSLCLAGALSVSAQGYIHKSQLAETDLVIRIGGICGKTLLKISLCCGKVFLMNGDSTEIIISDSLIGRRIVKDSKEPSIFVLRGDRKAAEKEWGDAAGNYENAILYSKGLPEAYVKYANAYFNVNPEYAIAKLQEFAPL